MGKVRSTAGRNGGQDGKDGRWRKGKGRSEKKKASLTGRRQVKFYLMEISFCQEAGGRCGD